MGLVKELNPDRSVYQNPGIHSVPFPLLFANPDQGNLSAQSYQVFDGFFFQILPDGLFNGLGLVPIWVRCKSASNSSSLTLIVVLIVWPRLHIIFSNYTSHFIKRQDRR